MLLYLFKVTILDIVDEVRPGSTLVVSTMIVLEHVPGRLVVIKEMILAKYCR